MSLFSEITHHVEQGNAPKTKAAIQEALADGAGPWEILNGGIMAGLRVVGDQLRDGVIALPEVMVSVGAVKAGLSLLEPLIVEKSPRGRGVVVIGTVAGDVHSLGKELVALMLEGSGFQVLDLGADVPPRRFVEAAERHGADVVAMSGLLTTSRLTMRETIQALELAGLRERLSILVGGGAVDRETAKSMGADAYGEDASVASDVVLRLLNLV
jgi:5-methyltetrahydrofolate--homocysteine methyltransferase